ncbi:uncharacterized protein C8A04DRAFT_13579 [Dichotomopilus funicola]|uniref:Uncharacterized protein n=1 Tax=Dichotomopilus funicola TaxID=1934379 RepID=A0AAN6ZL98_9PEZI|nr:hypothetical protein C8A04DRAFT_13579 [Dichotomopilus funicola]
MSSSSEEVGFVDPAVGAEREEGLGGNSFANPDPEGDIAKRVHDLEDWVDEKNFQYAGDKQLLDKTAADVKSLRKTVEQWVAKLGARATSSFGPGSGKGANSEDDIEGAPGAAGLWPLTSGETQTAVAFVALAVFVWLITEAMLHSKRLLDGYGPMFNGGYNGLGSVVVFGTWEKFFFFYGAALYLGQLPLSAIQRAMRRWDERVEGG